jgi:hypothetical protein
VEKNLMEKKLKESKGKYVPREKIWLSTKIKNGEWCYALARCKDGTIRVVEHLPPFGFCGVGNCGENDEIPCRLHAGERSSIIKDLFWACFKELGLSVSIKNLILRDCKSIGE